MANPCARRQGFGGCITLGGYIYALAPEGAEVFDNKGCHIVRVPVQGGYPLAGTLNRLVVATDEGLQVLGLSKLTNPRLEGTIALCGIKAIGRARACRTRVERSGQGSPIPTAF
jgi:hypothetical protein